MKSKIKLLSQREFRYIYSKVPRLCVDVIVKNNTGILLTRRGIQPDKGKWHIPGGTVLKGETINAAVKRVAKNELNIQVVESKIIGIIQGLPPSPHGHFVGIENQILKYKGTFTNTKQSEEIKFFSNLPKDIIKQHCKFIKETGLI